MIEEFKRELDKNKIRRINTLYSPDGCRRIHGKWDKKHNICILGEQEPGRSEVYGWTAPARGAFVWWRLGPYHNYRGIETYGGEIGVGDVKHCELYPDMPCTDPYDIYYEEINYDDENLIDFYYNIRDRGLKIASDIVRGRAYEHNMIYYDETGEIFSKPRSKNDKVGPMPCPACFPVPPSFHEPEGFRFKKRK